MRRAGVTSFSHERFSQALAVRRLPQGQLAALTGVSAGTVSKWRAGTQAPELSTLERIASALNVDARWLMKPRLPEVTPPHFRSNASAFVSARAMLKARLEWGQEIALHLEEFVDFPRVELPERNFRDPESISPEEIEAAADECRMRWGLGRGPIPDLALAVEGAGVILFREDTDIAQIEGLSAWSEPLRRPLILLSADKDNGYRSRFDLAHEVGHLVLHKHILRPSDRERYRQLETQAHRFAGALLLPADVFAAQLRGPITLDDLLVHKRRWGVSVAAMIIRLRDLGILDSEQVVNLFKRRSARWGAKQEPNDHERAPEQPRLMRRTLDMLVDAKVMTRDSIPGHIGLRSSDLEMLLSLPSGYFSGGQGAVVQLAQLRPSVVEGEYKSVNRVAEVVQFPSKSKI